MLPNPTLDQLQVFVAVAETGSFSAAARHLHRAQSVISYTIGNLEAQLQLTLLERSGSRQPVLTEAGRAILEDARRMLADLDALRARSKTLTEGLEGEVKLAVSVMVPDAILVNVLRSFQQGFPTVRLRLSVGNPFLVSRLLAQRAVDVGIGGSMEMPAEGITGERIGVSFLTPVAAAGHGLAKLGRRLSVSDVRDEIQIVVSDSTAPSDSRDFNVFSRRTWRVSDMATKKQLIVGGLGWGGVPVAMMRDELASGLLVRLDVDAYETVDYPIFACWPAASPPGPAAKWLVDQFGATLAQCPTSVSDALRLDDDVMFRAPAGAG
ncbi:MULTISPECIES: LysR family transcriptional regulator [Alphaproteobacteria]|uniref:LysR family transcriptional regulator n=2 Tax=Alphaproteobacteria TaxID=28211 RepID=A0A512HHC4_9HYPH|nr:MULTISPECIES: LysR family transcriptional regulator [Alphaproteobacteria]GEO84849.1 LysR family transcriptional regulator [Ciceribacter naphthalenivorans]GLR22783.1 LysR family transcriptional regulator [Ciceribacter naphthalenivorans]GLT05639.1 LysR family transcriptional regulator [Sphingomonas psychrolutea]